MENDATSAGVRHGGLFNTAEIKILICYILNAVNEPVPASMLANELHYEGIANGFEVSDAVISLYKSGHIDLFNASDDSYIINDKGREISETLKTELSLSVKNRAFAITVKMLSRFKNIKQTDFKIIYEKGLPYIECSVTDGKIPLMSIKLLLSDENQSSCIKERFLENPAELYKTIIEKLTK